MCDYCVVSAKRALTHHLKFIQVESVQDLPLFARFLELWLSCSFLSHKHNMVDSTRGRGNDIAEENDLTMTN